MNVNNCENYKSIIIFICRKHFPYEDYDEWLFGEEGVWGLNASAPRPDLLVLQMPLHTCVHGLDPHREGHHNASLIAQHEQDTAQLMRAVRGAVDRQPRKTAVIVMTGGRNFIKGPSIIINCKNNMEEIFLVI